MKAGESYIGVGLGIIIVNDNNEILLMKRGAKCKNEVGAWALVGGSLDFGETLEQGIIREVQEEIGAVVALDQQLPAFNHILKNENQHWITNVFIGHITQGKPTIMEPEKCEELKWFSVNTLPTPIAKMSQTAIDDFIKAKELL